MYLLTYVIVAGMFKDPNEKGGEPKKTHSWPNDVIPTRCWVINNTSTSKYQICLMETNKQQNCDPISTVKGHHRLSFCQGKNSGILNAYSGKIGQNIDFKAKKSLSFIILFPIWNLSCLFSLNQIVQRLCK